MTKKDADGVKSNYSRHLSDLSKLDRTTGSKHQHYSWREVAAANHAQEGQQHE